MDDAVVVGAVAVVAVVVAFVPPALLVVFPAVESVALPAPPALAGPTINVDVI